MLKGYFLNRFIKTVSLGAVLPCLIFCITSKAQTQTFEPDFSYEAYVEKTGRPNPYQLLDTELKKSIASGQVHAQKYPVSVTGVVLPEKPIRQIIENSTANPFKKILNAIFKDVLNLNEFNDLFHWLGLHQYPNTSDPQKYQIAYPADIKKGEVPDYLLGYSRLRKNDVTVFTMSCATCHSANLFGQTVLGLTNRFVRANDFFIRGKQATQYFNPHLFQFYTGASDAETKIMSQSVENLKNIETVKPLTLGLDTSLAQVALSLNRRAANEWADINPANRENPRPDRLDYTPADSKPSVWWNVKYKNRWLSDGSVVSGNPIFTNIIWNELGRGTDLRKLNDWFSQNPQVIRELTSMVFATEAPIISDFFPQNKIIPERAFRGEKLFNQTCARCHGQYFKNWSLPENNDRPWFVRMQTYKVEYFEQTQIYDVGTDPLRYQAMQSLVQLNDLKISKNHNIVIEPQEGYVPPPLVGIWARWPYFHNNSAPSLCAVLTASNKRPITYYAAEANNRDTDFDFDCNGYPALTKIPARWKKSEYLYDTRRAGMRNTGHDERIFIKDGKEILSSEDKKDLIQFLQTL